MCTIFSDKPFPPREQKKQPFIYIHTNVGPSMVGSPGSKIQASLWYPYLRENRSWCKESVEIKSYICLCIYAKCIFEACARARAREEIKPIDHNKSVCVWRSLFFFREYNGICFFLPHKSLFADSKEERYITFRPRTKRCFLAIQT